MSALPKPKLTVAEYLARERRAEFKSEFFNGEVFAMAGASRADNFVKENLIGELFARLKNGPCGTSQRSAHIGRSNWLVHLSGYHHPVRSRGI